MCSKNQTGHVSIMKDYELFNGRKTYADSVTGAYYANRLALAEYLEKVKNRNKPLTRMADYFDKLVFSEALAGKTFHNPINREGDVFKNPPREVQQGTKRKRLAGWVLEELKKAIRLCDPKQDVHLLVGSWLQ